MQLPCAGALAITLDVTSPAKPMVRWLYLFPDRIKVAFRNQLPSNATGERSRCYTVGSLGARGNHNLVFLQVQYVSTIV
jgi:hypothetical protein